MTIGRAMPVRRPPWCGAMSGAFQSLIWEAHIDRVIPAISPVKHVFSETICTVDYNLESRHIEVLKYKMLDFLKECTVDLKSIRDAQ